MLVQTKDDLDRALSRWTSEAEQVPPAPATFTSVLITIEGMHAVQGIRGCRNLAPRTPPSRGPRVPAPSAPMVTHAGVVQNLDRLFDEGVRMMGIAHFFDNELGGSNTGEEKHGLTPLGAPAGTQARLQWWRLSRTWCCAAARV